MWKIKDKGSDVVKNKTGKHLKKIKKRETVNNVDKKDLKRKSE